MNDTGRAQARLIRDELAARGHRFSVASSSPLARAVETAEIILAGSTTLYHADPALIELSLGDYEGRLEAELRTELGDAYPTWRSKHFTEPAPNGESLYDGVRRVAPALSALRASAAAEDALIVAHQGILMSVKLAISGHDELDAIASFRQANDAVEAWDMSNGRRLETLCFTCAATRTRPASS